MCLFNSQFVSKRRGCVCADRCWGSCVRTNDAQHRRRALWDCKSYIDIGRTQLHVASQCSEAMEFTSCLQELSVSEWHTLSKVISCLFATSAIQLSCYLKALCKFQVSLRSMQYVNIRHTCLWQSAH